MVRVYEHYLRDRLGTWHIYGSGLSDPVIHRVIDFYRTDRRAEVDTAFALVLKYEPGLACDFYVELADRSGNIGDCKAAKRRDQMSGKIWMFSNYIDEEDIRWLQHDYVTLADCIDYYGLGYRPMIRTARAAGAVLKIGTKMVRIDRWRLETYMRQTRRRDISTRRKKTWDTQEQE